MRRHEKCEGLTDNLTEADVYYCEKFTVYSLNCGKHRLPAACVQTAWVLCLISVA
jgi:hypothetical protein